MSKPVDLTKTERDALMHHIGAWKFERQGLARAEDAFMAEVSRIVAAREAAALAEGWDEGYRLDWTGGVHWENPYRATEETR